MNRIMIIDDESHARDTLRHLVSEHCPEITIVGEAGSIADAVQGIRSLKPDGLLLDISLEDGSGFDLLDFFPNPDFRVIFTTAHDEYALKAFRYNALNYLLKPIIPSELFNALTQSNLETVKVSKEKIGQLRQFREMNQPDRIALNTMEGLIFLKLGEILYLEADGNYTTFHLQDREKVIVSRPLGEFEELLPETLFFRIHQSYIVRLASVHKVLKEDGCSVRLDSGHQIPVARRRKEAFLRALGQ